MRFARSASTGSRSRGPHHLTSLPPKGPVMPFATMEIPVIENSERTAENAVRAIKKMNARACNVGALRKDAADVVARAPLMAVGVAFGGGLLLGALVGFRRRPVENGAEVKRRERKHDLDEIC